MSPLYQSSRVRPPPPLMPMGVAIRTPTPPRRVNVQNWAISPLSSPCRPADGSGFHTPLDTPTRNLFTLGRAGPLNDDHGNFPRGWGPQVLFGDIEVVSGDESMTHSHSSLSCVNPSDDSAITTSSDLDADFPNYLEACRLLGLSPMVQPANRRRCRTYSPSTEASSSTLGFGHGNDFSSLSSFHER